MFFPYIKDKVQLNISPDDFFFHLNKFVNSLKGKEDLHYVQKDSHNCLIFSKKTTLFRRYNITKGEFRVFTKNGEKNKIEVSYKLSFTKWFLSMIFTSFLFLSSIAIFYFYKFGKMNLEVHIFQHMFFAINILFWVVLWPVTMNIFYGMILRRIFKTLFLSFEFRKR